MRLRVLPRLLASLAMLALLLPGVAQAAPPADDRIPDQYIVTFHDTTVDPAGKARGLANRHNLGLLHTYEHAIKGFAARIPAPALARIQADPDVASVVQDRRVSIAARPEASARPGSGAPTTSTQTVPSGIRRINATLAHTDGKDERINVNVAVIDTGISKHDDLNLVGGKNCSTGRSYSDGNGHGTHVAGSIGALDNGIGVVGVAPGARLWAVRVLDNSGSGSWSSVICGVDWVTANASTIKVANMSLGGGGSEGSCTDGGLHQAICNSVKAGVTYVVAAGNSASDASAFVPATYDEVITVSALADFNGAPGGGAVPTCRSDVDDTLADFSNYGADVDLIAPGVCILSTWSNGGYNTISGTSMASPHVAGAAALYKSKNPTATPAQVKAALQNAGSTNWSNADDGDSIKEKALDVSDF